MVCCVFVVINTVRSARVRGLAGGACWFTWPVLAVPAPGGGWMEPPMGPPLDILLADIFVFFFSESLSFFGEIDIPRFLTTPLWPLVGVFAVPVGVFATPVGVLEGTVVVFPIDVRRTETLLALTTAGGVLVAALKSSAQAPPACVVDVEAGACAEEVGAGTGAAVGVETVDCAVVETIGCLLYTSPSPRD